MNKSEEHANQNMNAIKIKINNLNKLQYNDAY